MPSEPTTVELVDSHLECDDVWRFSFTRPEGYSFVPGQAMALRVDTPAGPSSHYFSHADAPGDEHALVVTRDTGSEYKRALRALKPGDRVGVSGPIGRLIVPAGARKVGFLVGGVGITPASSIVRDAVQRATGLECLVIYGNAAEPCIPLRAEFDSYEAAAPGVRCVHVLSDADERWTGERGHITADVVRRHCDPLDGWHWMLSGTPAMVDAMRALLTELDVPAADVSFEQFSGYGA